MSADVETLLQQAKRLTSEERVELIKCLEDSLFIDENLEKRDYLALFGSGRGGYATPDEADTFIRQERDAWEN